MSTKPFSIRLATEEREILELIATELGCFSERGNTKGQPSIGALLKGVACGRLVVSELGSAQTPRPAESPTPRANNREAGSAHVRHPAEVPTPREVGSAQTPRPVEAPTPRADSRGASSAKPTRKGSSTRQATKTSKPVPVTAVNNEVAPRASRKAITPLRRGSWSRRPVDFPSIRIGLTGASGSGKSTAIHCFLAHALRFAWEQVILLDGKGSELCFYEGLDGVTYWGPEDTEEWAEVLTGIVAGYDARYAALTARGVREAQPGDGRYLVIVDEVQHGTRDEPDGKVKKAISLSLQIMSEKGRALGDCLLVSSQRGEGNIPKPIRHNLNAGIQMMGNGYFVLDAKGLATRSGRTKHLSPTDVTAMLDHPEPTRLVPVKLLAALGAKPVQPGKARARLYVGNPGSGLTHRLKQHPRGSRPRVIYIDFAIGHKPALEQLIRECHAIVPNGAQLHDLDALAAQALSSEETLLLADNISRARSKARASIERLINWCGEVALAADMPASQKETDALTPFFDRCEVVEIEPLPKSLAMSLADEWLSLDVENRDVLLKNIIEKAEGNPKRLARLCERVQRGGLEELRGIRNAPGQEPYTNISILLIVPIFFVAYNLRGSMDHWLLGAISIFVYILARSLISKMSFEVFK